MDGSLSLGSPDSDHVGNQQEARFIGKDNMGAQPCSVFLRAASSLVSNARCLLHSAPEHVALVGVCRLACHPPVLAGVMMRYSTKIGATTLRPIIVYFID